MEEFDFEPRLVSFYYCLCYFPSSQVVFHFDCLWININVSHILEKDTYFFCSSDKGEIWFNSDVESLYIWGLPTSWALLRLNYSGTDNKMFPGTFSLNNIYIFPDSRWYHLKFTFSPSSRSISPLLSVSAAALIFAAVETILYLQVETQVRMCYW